MLEEDNNNQEELLEEHNNKKEEEAIIVNCTGCGVPVKKGSKGGRIINKHVYCFKCYSEYTSAKRQIKEIIPRQLSLPLMPCGDKNCAYTSHPDIPAVYSQENYGCKY